MILYRLFFPTPYSENEKRMSKMFFRNWQEAYKELNESAGLNWKGLPNTHKLTDYQRFEFLLEYYQAGFFVVTPKRASEIDKKQLLEIIASDDLHLLKKDTESKLVYNLKRLKYYLQSKFIK